MRAWLAAALGAACAVVAACSTTNITNVTVSPDGGEQTGSTSDAGTDGEVGEPGKDASPDDRDAEPTEAGVCTGPEPSGPKRTWCRVMDDTEENRPLACDACGAGGFVYACKSAPGPFIEGTHPDLPHCALVDGKTCCRGEWMRSPDYDGRCFKASRPHAFIGPQVQNGGAPVFDLPSKCELISPAETMTAQICCG